LHNHLSRDPTPSKEACLPKPGEGRARPPKPRRRRDIEITRRLREAGEMMGVRVLDHVIIGKGRYVSMVDDGYW
jgi:DNA repair protein RadC